ncbi:MAG: deoxyhypusine synthase family protein, partial [Nanoarchaeota archaeon]
KSGLVLLGSGVAKHAILNANMFRNGADYAVYINNAQEFDASDAGGFAGRGDFVGEDFAGRRNCEGLRRRDDFVPDFGCWEFCSVGFYI